MKIICTVKELVAMARGCAYFRNTQSCSKCVMYEICSQTDGFIEQFVSADNVVKENADA